MRTYRIRQVDDNEYADDIAEIERQCFLPKNPYDDVWWWLAFWHDAPVAYAGLMPSFRNRKTIAYIPRMGTLKQHRGARLQYRLLRVMEAFARQQAFREIVTDTTDNPPSANNFIRAGYFTYAPQVPWAFANSIYWRKVL